MKIAMISWEYPPQFSGGLGIHCQAIVRELTGLGVFIDYYLPAYQNAEFTTPPGMKINHVKMPKQSSALAYQGNDTWDMVMKFRDELQKAFLPPGVDVIHARDWMGVLAAAEIAQQYGIPLIWTVHSTEYDRAAGMPVHPGIATIEQAALQIAAHTIAVSKRTKISLVERYQAAAEKITVIHNGVDASPFEQMAQRDYDRDDGHILFLGRVTGQKGPEYFLEAARIVLAKKNVRFLIAGDGDLLGILRRRARRWKIDDRVQFSGAVEGERLLQCYRDALLFVLPAYSEPFGITVLEAMAAGVPAIISTTTGAGEIVTHVEKVEPNDSRKLAQAILFLLENPQRRAMLGKKGAEEAWQWSWKRTAEETLSLYRQLSKTEGWEG